MLRGPLLLGCSSMLKTWQLASPGVNTPRKGKSDQEGDHHVFCNLIITSAVFCWSHRPDWYRRGLYDGVDIKTRELLGASLDADY